MQRRSLAGALGLCAIAVLGLAACAPMGQPPATSPQAEIVRAATQAWNSGDLDAALSFYADDAVITTTGADGETQVITGKLAIRDFMGGMLQLRINLHAWSRSEIVRVQGDTVTTRTEGWDDLIRAWGRADHWRRGLCREEQQDR
jgi:ketosteroid isomerase-like protein